MFRRVLMPAVVLSLASACNRSPAPEPEKPIPDQVLPSYQAALPARSGATSDAITTPAAAAQGSLTNPEAESLTDAQIARITSDANAAEINQGKLALTKAKDPAVKRFAERMVKHHTEAKNKQEKLKLDTADSALATKLEHDGSNTLAALTANSDAGFDQEYMADQVKEHQRVLDTIDQQLLPNAKNEALKSYLASIRPTVESHLKDAREIEAKLMPAPH